MDRGVVIRFVVIVLVMFGASDLVSADRAGSLLVESDPSGASVYVDGRLAGETPLTVTSIAVGVHRVRLVRLGYLENSRLVTIGRGERATLHARLTDPLPQTAQAGALKIVVLEGEAAVNIIQQKTAVAPVIEVRDRNDQPVAGAIVRFAIQRGHASFNGARTLSVTTDAAGRAAATGLTATGRGALQITASAAFQGQTAAATIAQTTVMTASEASSITSGTAAASGGGGGLSNTAIAGVVGGAGAGIAAAVLRSNPAPPSISTSPIGSGIRDVTVFTFTTAGGSNKTSSYVWDFGDGSNAEGTSVSHIFSSVGSFTVAIRPPGSATESASTVITVRSLDGVWIRPLTGGVGFSVVLTQSGNSLIGQWITECRGQPPVPPGIGQCADGIYSYPMTGTIKSPREVTLIQGGECLRTISATANEDLSQLTGRSSAANTACITGDTLTFIRQ